jgi:uncharacterized protein with HEPN domain
MPSKRAADDLRDILAQIDLADKFIGTMTFEEFEVDELRLYAVIRCLEIISEASRRLPPNLKGGYPDIQWKAIAGAGNIYRHNYEDVLAIKIWETVKLALPELRRMVANELSADDL